MALSDLPSDERAIVASILDAASAAGLLASVFDGEVYAVGQSSDYARVPKMPSIRRGWRRSAQRCAKPAMRGNLPAALMRRQLLIVVRVPSDG